MRLICGIAGIFYPDAGKLSSKTIKRRVRAMIAAIRHRGPDDQDIYCGANVGLGACRLSILDLSASGRMPMLDDETGNRIVHNGEVYNYLELKEALGASAPFKSQTDTEVILKAYARHGADCVNRFNGMYAFCIFDKKRNRLFCARDRIGIKPFFYAFHRGVFYFASEIKSLLAIGLPRRPNGNVICDYLAHGVYDHSE